MISIKDNVFKLDTKDTSYVFSVTEKGHLEHIYYGARLAEQDYTALRLKNEIQLGSTVEYEADTPVYSLDTTLLEYSGVGKGDFRHSPTELIMPDGTFVTDFIYESSRVLDGSYTTPTLPTAYGDGETLEITLSDRKYSDIKLKLNYTVYYGTNVIARNTELINGSQGEVYIRKLMSLMVDFADSEYDLLTFDGSWAKEAHEHRRSIEYGIYVNDSTTGSSSNRHNAGVMLASRGADNDHGGAYAFNLVYSGNHYTAVEKAPFDTLRIMSGINPHCFLWRLKTGESFVTPQAVMSFGDKGLNSVSANMHAFVNEHIVRGEYKSAERPVVINNWEATFFNFNCRKLHSLAGRAKKLGVEMFVLDDGWFGARSDDTAGLGDWVVNKKKLPGGIKRLSRRINKLGMKFGLWFEPECVNQNSDLYRAHPEWALKVEGRHVSFGRNQMVLDLSRPEVCDYIIDSVDKVLCESNIEYVKWDYNRHISDMQSSYLKNQGELYHRYILGLYRILDEIFYKRHPNILFESCSSGGNRFDLGMLCYSPQIWTSDNTDPIERLDIQSGIYRLYPQSTVSAHVSMAPHQQTLRDTPLSTRFNVACFGVLGYELDFSELTRAELRAIKEQIAFYKEQRRTLQYGRLRIHNTKDKTRYTFSITADGECIVGLFQNHIGACPGRDILRVEHLDAEKEYTVRSVKQYLRIKRFGALIKHIVPFKINTGGALVRLVDKNFEMTDGCEEYTVRGDALISGINLAMQYEGTGYSDKLRILGDYGSNLYIIKEKK
ncbi:MAG: alpha-galactosidase [Clostridia bacterium]|nr:alpha-galactosidase [Clostridia bacterium]